MTGAAHRRRWATAPALAFLLAGPGASAQTPLTPSREYVYAGDRLLAIVSPPLLSIDDVAVIEGQSGTTRATFTVSLSMVLPQPVTVAYSTADGTAMAGMDYVSASGTVTFAAGATSPTAIEVTVNGDTDVEGRETFVVNLTNPMGAALGRPQGLTTIVDDEASRFFALSPCRLADTRDPQGPSGGPALAANTSRDFPAAGLCGVPSTARAVALIVTTTGQTGIGNLRLYPAPGPAPLASMVNFSAFKARAGNGTVALGHDGMVGVRCDMPTGQAGQTHVILDVMGYFQ